MKLFYFHLVRDWISLVPPTALLAGIGYMSYKAFCPKAREPVSNLCNILYLSFNTSRALR